MELLLEYGYRLPMVEVPLYLESTPKINNKVASDSKRRIDRVDHKFWNGTNKSAETFFIPYIFRRLGWAVSQRGSIVGGSP
jgi:hypothetical protein